MMMATNHFERLSLPRRFALRPEELEANYHAAAREHHPDRHMQAEAARRVTGALRTAELTEAYRTLKDPVRRADYLLGLLGITISDERGGHRVSPAFLAEILELREALMDARMENDDARVRTLGGDVKARHAQALGAIGEGFARYEANGDRAVLDSIADALVAVRYFRRFLDEVDAYEEARLEELNG